ncbi:hypothetical protein [Deinococcus marmoris]
MKPATLFAVLALSLPGSAQAGRGLTLHVLVDRTMFGSTPGSEGQVRGAVLQAVTRLVPGVDRVRLGSLCGAPATVYEAQVGRDLTDLARVLDREVLQPCATRGSRLNDGLKWAAAGAAGGLLLVTDTAFSDDPARAQLPSTARVLTLPVAVVGARSADRDAFDSLFRTAPAYVGTRGLADAQDILRLFLRRLRR